MCVQEEVCRQNERFSQLTHQVVADWKRSTPDKAPVTQFLNYIQKNEASQLLHEL